MKTFAEYAALAVLVITVLALAPLWLPLAGTLLLWLIAAAVVGALALGVIGFLMGG